MRHEHENIPDDVRDVSEALDALGASERDSACAGLEARIFSATAMAAAATPTDVAAVESAAERLGQQERESAAPGLEDRVYVLTAARLGGVRRIVGRVSLARGWMRMAAAVAVLVGAGMVWWATREAPRLVPQGETPDVAAFKSDLEAFLAMEEEDAFEAEFDVIYAKAALLDDTLESSWIDDELFSVEEEM